MSATTAAGLHATRALVTGGTRGIGAATATRLGEAGAAVVVAARTQPEGAPAGEITFVAADLATAQRECSGSPTRTGNTISRSTCSPPCVLTAAGTASRLIPETVRTLIATALTGSDAT